VKQFKEKILANISSRIFEIFSFSMKRSVFILKITNLLII